MSSPFNADLLALLRRHVGGRKVTLALIELTEPSALTLRYATTEVVTPDGIPWQAGLSCQPIRHFVNYLGPGIAPADATIRLAKRRDASQTSGTLHDLLSDYLWQNALVTLYIWDQDHDDAADLAQVFRGFVSRPVEVDVEGMTLHLLQDMSWNLQTPPVVVDKTSYPDSPDVSQGLPVPIVYGDHISPPMRSPWTTTYTSKTRQEDAGAGEGVVPLVLVDSGVGAASVKVVAAGHSIPDVLNRTDGHTIFMAGDGLLHPLDTTGVTESPGATESYISVADENAIAYAPVIPIDVRASENTALTPRRAMDPRDETSYASLNQSTANGILQLVLPNLGPSGRIESVQVSVAFIGNAGNGNNIRVDARVPGVGAGGGAAVTTASTGTTPAVMTGTWPATYWNQDWAFGTRPSDGAVLDIRVDFTGGAANQARVLWVALVVRYRPQRSIVTPGKTFTIYGPPPGHPSGTGVPTSYQVAVQPIQRLEGQFFGNVKGYVDDGGGTYTGTGGAVIQRPPDIMRHFLETYGGVSSSDIETGASTTGSFVDARATLRNAQVNDMKLACWIGERTTVQRVLQGLAEQSGMCVYLCRYTNKWLGFVWKPGATADYDRSISYFELASLSVEETSVVDVRHSIRVKYGHDYFKSRSLYEAFVTAASSGQGINLPTTRDQRLTVTAGANDDIDFSVGGGAAVLATLTPGTYTPIELAEEARIQCRAAATNNVDCGYGFSIAAGFNDLLDWTVGATAYQGTLEPGDYTAEALATEFARAMNAETAPFTYACTYSHSTNKFTVTSPSTVTVLGVCNNTIGTNTITRLTGSFLSEGVEVGHYVNHANFGANTRVTIVTALTVTCSGVSALGFANDDVTFEPRFAIDGTTGAAGYTTSAAHVMGHVSLAVTAAVSVTAEVERYGDRFWFSYGVAASNINMLWGSGANVLTNAAFLLGYPRTDSGTTRSNPAAYSRGDRERVAATYEGYYGPREERQITADFIRDETTAVELRNRIFDLTARPRVVVRFATHRMPDVRVMQVIELSADVDPFVAYPKYGSDGSWSGKPLRVLEVEQHLGPSYHQEVLAIGAE